MLLARDPVQNELFEIFDPAHERRPTWKTATDDLGRHPVVELRWWEATAFGWLVDHLLSDTDWYCRLPRAAGVECSSHGH
jgi:hypothetical protein